MKSVILVLLTVLAACNEPSAGFLTCSRSHSGRLYFFSDETQLDKSRKVFVLCTGLDSAHSYSRYEVVPFDSADYFYLDPTFEPDHMPDSALVFPESTMNNCLRGIGVQLSADFTVISRTILTHSDITKDSRLDMFKPDCEEMDRAELFELKTITGDAYSVYDVNVSRQCHYLTSVILLFHGSTLINKQTFY